MTDKQARSIWVVGHKNPDTDSICAAITYANLKNATESNIFIPKKAGSLNEETRYVLERFGVEEPQTIETAGVQLKDIEFRHTDGVSGHYSLKKAWKLMKEEDVVTLPIVNSNQKLEGLIVNGDIAYSYMDVYDNHILSQSRTQYKNIIETLNGRLITGNDHAYFINGKVVVAAGNREFMRQEIEQDDLVILGNVKERQLIAIEENASCMIVCGVSDVDQEVIEKAAQMDCVVITTEFDSFTAARLIHQSMPIRQFMKKENLITFDLDDYIDDVKEVMSKVRHRDFPILDEQRHYIGMVSRRNLLNMQKKQLILVDHNEKSQAVDGIEETEILEIIDHHRLGSLETISPIFFRNQPLGCTSTIIYQMYQEKDVEVEPKMAGLLCSAILSDTLMFRSPTCTPMDKQAAETLAKIAGVEVEELATAMFEAGSDFKSKTTEEIFYQDFKTFSLDEADFGVAQVSAVSEKQLKSIKANLQTYMNTVLATKNIDMVFLMLTNILNEETELLYAGNNAEDLIRRSFGAEHTGDSFILPGVVSRKKQLIPVMIETLQN